MRDKRSVMTLDLELEQSLELPFTWMIGSCIHSIWTQRENRTVELIRTRAQLEARCRLLRESRAKTWNNSSIIAEAILAEIFEWKLVQPHCIIIVPVNNCQVGPFWSNIRTLSCPRYLENSFREGLLQVFQQQWCEPPGLRACVSLDPVAPQH